MPEPNPSPTPRRAALLVNPTAGSAPGDGDGVDALMNALSEAGFALVAPPRIDLPLDAQCDAALQADPEVIFTLGGDGSLRGIAERLAGSDVVLGVLPGGTMNRLAARLDLPGDPVAAIRRLATAEVVPLPTGRLNGRLFLYQCLAGRSSRLVRFREMQRSAGRLGWLLLIVAALRMAARPPRRALRLHGTDETIRADAIVVTMPRPDEPAEFQVDAVRRGSRLTGLRQAWRWIRGKLAQDPDVVALARPSLVVIGRDAGIRVTLDGEQELMRPPLRFRLQPGGLRVLRPRRA